jgi:hypothetical protein
MKVIKYAIPQNDCKDFTYIQVKWFQKCDLLTIYLHILKLLSKLLVLKLSNYIGLFNTVLSWVNLILHCLKEKCFTKLNSFMKNEQSKNII